MEGPGATEGELTADTKHPLSGYITTLPVTGRSRFWL
jgi:hypothetical protein